MTLHGFAALELISPTPCRPCDADRAGISIGEAAGFALLERAGCRRRDGGAARRLALLGMGAGQRRPPHVRAASGRRGGDRRDAAGAATAPAWRRATVDWINLHGTGTRANDAAEDLAVVERVRRRRAVQFHQRLDRPHPRRLRHPGGGHRRAVHGSWPPRRLPRGGDGRSGFRAQVAIANLDRPARAWSATPSASAASIAAWCWAACRERARTMNWLAARIIGVSVWGPAWTAGRPPRRAGR